MYLCVFIYSYIVFETFRLDEVSRFITSGFTRTVNSPMHFENKQETEITCIIPNISHIYFLIKLKKN